MKFLDFVKNKIRFWGSNKNSPSRIKKFFTSAIFFVKNGVKNIGKQISPGLFGFGKWFLSLFSKIGQLVSNFLKISGAKISVVSFATKKFLKNCSKFLSKGAASISSWCLNAIKITGAKTGSGFATAISFVGNGVKNIGKVISTAFVSLGRSFILVVCKIWAAFLAFFVAIKLFFKICSKSLIKGAGSISSWCLNAIKITGAKTGSGFATTISFVVNGVKNIGKLINLGFFGFGKWFLSMFSKIGPWISNFLKVSGAKISIIFFATKKFLKNCSKFLSKGAGSIFSWSLNAIKITGSKISSGFATAISFVVNGVKDIGKTISTAFAFLGRSFVLVICKIWAAFLAFFVAIKLFFKSCSKNLIKGAGSISSWFAHAIKITGAKISSGFATTISFVGNGLKNVGKVISTAFASLGRRFVLVVCRIWAAFLAFFVAIKLFFKSCSKSLTKGAGSISSWFAHTIKITGAKISSGFATIISFVVNGVKSVRKAVSAFFCALGRGFALIVSRIVLGILAGFVFVTSFFKTIFVGIYNAIVLCCLGIGNSIKYFLLAVWYGIVSVFYFFNKMLFGTARGVKTGLVYSKAFVASRMKFIGTSLAVVAGVIFLAFSGQWYFNKQNEFLFTSKNIQNDFVEMLDRKLSVTQAELKGYIDQKFEKNSKEIDSVKDIDKKLDTVKELNKKMSLNQGEIKEYIDKKFEKNEKELSVLKKIDTKLVQNKDEIKGYVDQKLQKSYSKDESVFLKDLDQKLSTTQEKIAEYIDQKLKKIDNKIDSLKEEKKSYSSNVDGTIKEAVRNQMSALKEERLKKLIKQQKREKRKKLLRKMLDADDEL